MNWVYKLLGLLFARTLFIFSWFLVVLFTTLLSLLRGNLVNTIQSWLDLILFVLVIMKLIASCTCVKVKSVWEVSRTIARLSYDALSMLLLLNFFYQCHLLYWPIGDLVLTLAVYRTSSLLLVLLLLLNRCMNIINSHRALFRWKLKLFELVLWKFKQVLN